ncbi:MAG: putative lipid II flippase FtsW [Candidatus Ancaeobacter aquaticus]|nr:putative lipid II flippase FtsW [Candidatus Ancaeobacter aquaticus]
MQRERILIFIIVMVLLSISIIMIYSTSAIYADSKFGASNFFLKRQILWVIIGVIGFFVCSQIDYHFLRKFSKILLIVSIALLLAVFIPYLGRTAGGAQRWVSLGFFSFQPSEIAKFAVILYLADFLDRKRGEVRSFFKGFLPLCFVLGTVLLLIIIQPDLGTVIAITLVALIMFFIGGIRIAHIVTLLLASIPALYLLIFRVAYRRRRILTFLDPWKDPQGAGFQIIQSFIALGSGGIFGVGLGHSMQKLFYLPEAHTDFIFSILGEELGLIGTLSVVILFVLLTIIGAKIAYYAPDIFGILLASGIVSMIALQSIINISVVTGSVPTKGLPLPFISFGGTNLVLMLCATGILLSIAKQSQRRIVSDPFGKKNNRIVNV